MVRALHMCRNPGELDLHLIRSERKSPVSDSLLLPFRCFQTGK
jgi:hypothetical protein